MNRRFHPVAACAYAGALFSCAMLWANPLRLLLLLCLTGAVLFSISARAAWRRALRFALPLALLIGCVNALFSGEGETTLFEGPPRICLESLVFGLASGARIILVLSIFCLACELVPEDEMFTFLSRLAPKSALAASLAMRALPRIGRDFERLRGMMRLRGAPLEARGARARIRAYGPLLHAILFGSLEGAWDTAISLHARAFGSGKRSAYRPVPWKAPDFALGAAGLAALALCIGSAARGGGQYRFYPSLGPLLESGEAAFVAAVLGVLAAGYAAARSMRK